MENTIRTAIGARLQTILELGAPFTALEHTTLNEKFSIEYPFTLPVGVMPTIGYVAVGNGGHDVVTGVNNIPVNKRIPHRPTDCALFNQLPFVMRTFNNDLTPAQQKKYRLRKEITVGSTKYIAYYLKYLDVNGVMTQSINNVIVPSATNYPQILYKTVQNGTVTSTAWTPTAANLNPVPPKTTTTGAVSTTSNYISATAQVPFVMDAFELSEYQNVANIIYGDPSFAIISEMALCAGIDTQVTATIGGVQSTYTEAIAVQVMDFITTYYATEFVNNNINAIFDVGAVEPLFETL